MLCHTLNIAPAAICDDMISTSKAILDAMRADFEQLLAGARSKPLDMLCQSEVESLE